MSDRGKPPFALPSLLDPDYGIVLHAYVQLPLFTREGNGSWVAPLKRFKMCELRLVECVAATAGEPVLRVELVDRRSSRWSRADRARSSRKPSARSRR